YDVEVVGQVTELPGAEIDRAGDHAQVVDPLALPRVAEARDAPHLVAFREVTRQRVPDVAGGPGDEDLLVLEQRRRLLQDGRRSRSHSFLFQNSSSMAR